MSDRGESLPPGWALSTLSELVTAPIIYGILQPGPDVPTGVPYVRPTEINKDLIQIADLRRTSERIAQRYRRSFLEPADIILSIVGTIGKVALVPVSLKGGNITQSSARVRAAQEALLPEFAAYALRSPLLRRQYAAARLGTAVPRLNLAHVRELRVPIAPLPEQRRIVDAIDSYFTRLDDGVDSLERVRTKLKAYRASVLKAAVEGRLVPTEASLARKEKRDYEPAATLLTRVLKKRRRRWEESELARLIAAGKPPKDDKWKAKYEEPVAPDARLLPKLPNGWCWVTLDQLLAEPLANGKSVRDGDGIPVLRLTSIKSGVVDVTERKSGDWTNVDPQKFLVEADDFLIIRGNGSIHLVGRGGRVRAGSDRVAYPDTLIRARVDPAALYPPLLARWWDSPSVREHIERCAKTTAGIYKINQADLGQTPMPLAPMPEQARICDELERVDTTAIAATVTIETGVRRCSRLRQAVLKWAFEGKLANQDPHDEPAKAVLARIRAEPAAVFPTKQSRGRRAKGAA